MSTFSTIPKQAAPRSELAYQQRIPKIIWQTMKTNRVPPILKDFADSWIENNPEYEYRLCDDDDIIEFIQSDFPEYLEPYLKIKHGASKADLWRYLVIYQYGGVYADSDCRCLVPLREWVDPDSEYVTQLGINNDVCQWLIISVAKNPIFLRAAEKAIKNLENDQSNAAYRGFEFVDRKLRIRKGPVVDVSDHVFGLAGPPVLQEAAEECFNDGSIAELLESTQIVCVSGEKSCQMSGNVIHDCGNRKYLKALKLLKTRHYAEKGSVSRVFAKLKSWRFAAPE